MNISITARHFKAHESLREYAFQEIQKLEKYYDGIISAEIIFSYEKAQNSIKNVELIVAVQGTVLKALDKSDDYAKSLDMAIDKMESQIKKYKDKHHQKNKKEIRKVRQKI